MNIGQILAFDCRSKCDAVSEQTTNDVRDGQEKPTHVARARDLGDTNTPVKLYISARPSDTVDATQRLTACLDDIALWMASNRLKLNLQRLTSCGAQLTVDIIS